ncbi:3-keto-disaccharide hydrolase [Sediminicola luteus]|uniref:3-keto-alpha-glucoside-1,2-lyase/3-keto-2-hydroxy-glucal hydratase domain-containing protein n=1 Tax=Sediminicola luteus TaxID=319238 RepID=A0A2A4G8V1_9FLAO|nr:DUF1080 domain-containing protein [Sediminicola luteus]PCE64404.1 hypothetical protein B7P33_08930 [Sediminicola luteus]
MKFHKSTALFIALLLCTTVATAQETETLFDGSNLDAWQLPTDTDHWSIDKGVLTARNDPEQKGSILWTKKTYTDFVIETDFLFGHGRVDSGIFIRTDRQQIQLGNSGSKKRDMTASPYIPGKGYPVEAVGVEKLLKLRDWNHIKIEARGKQYEVWLNGELVLSFHSEDAIEKGPIGLQLHPKRDMCVSFKNITVTEL